MPQMLLLLRFTRPFRGRTIRDRISIRTVLLLFVYLLGLPIPGQSEPSTLGPQPTLVLLVRFADSPAPMPITPEAANHLVFDQLNEWLGEVSYERFWLHGHVSGWHTLAVTESQVQTYEGCDRLKILEAAIDFLETETNTLPLANFERLILMFPQVNCGFAGYGASEPITLLSQGQVIQLSVLWAPAQNRTILAHEMGHTLGLGHPGALDCGDVVIGPEEGKDCISRHPFDWYDNMGKGQLAHYSAPNKAMLGWLDADQIITVNPAGDVGMHTIIPLSAPASIAGPRAVRFRTRVDGFGRGHWYYLEYRQPIGFDDQPQWALERDVYQGALLRLLRFHDPSVNKVEKDLPLRIDFHPGIPSSALDYQQSALLSGEIYEAPSGWHIEIESADSQALTARITLPAHSQIPREPLAMDQLTIQGSTALARKHRLLLRASSLLAGLPTQGSINDPSLHGGRLRFYQGGSFAGAVELSAYRWQSRSNEFRFRSDSQSPTRCKIRIKRSKKNPLALGQLRVRCKGEMVPWDPPITDNLDFILEIGQEAMHYCTRYEPSENMPPIRNRSELFQIKKLPSPDGCQLNQLQSGNS